MLALLAAGFTGCSQQRRWNQEQRKAMRESLRGYRQMTYVNDLNDDEFVVFGQRGRETRKFVPRLHDLRPHAPGMEDSVEMVVVTTVVDELNADPRNMRHIYPYPTWCRRACCPRVSTVSSSVRSASRFAAKVNARYATMNQFFNAVLQRPTRPTAPPSAAWRTRCANDLFGWLADHRGRCA